MKLTDARLTRQSADRLVFTFTPSPPKREPAAPPASPQQWEVSIDDVERDSDGDGWTDHEEARLGLDAHDADSDGDDLPDGRDPAPRIARPRPAPAMSASRCCRRPSSPRSA
jgi:hypothetical protein